MLQFVKGTLTVAVLGLAVLATQDSAQAWGSRGSHSGGSRSEGRGRTAGSYRTGENLGNSRRHGDRRHDHYGSWYNGYRGHGHSSYRSNYGRYNHYRPSYSYNHYRPWYSWGYGNYNHYRPSYSYNHYRPSYGYSHYRPWYSWGYSYRPSYGWGYGRYSYYRPWYSWNRYSPMFGGPGGPGDVTAAAPVVATPPAPVVATNATANEDEATTNGNEDE
jgi:hypothetical protein